MVFVKQETGKKGRKVKDILLFTVIASAVTLVTAVILLISGPEADRGIWQCRHLYAEKEARNSPVWISTWEPVENWEVQPVEVGRCRMDDPVLAGRKDGTLNSSPVLPDNSADRIPAFWQLQYLPWKNSYLYSHDKSINGVALGYYMPQKEINGVSLAMFHLFNTRKSGFSMSLIDLCVDSSGFSMFVAGGAVVNNGCSVGVWNLTENNRGVQIGVFNREVNDLLLEYPLKPEKRAGEFGVQAGLVNYSDSPGVQFGLWNTNPNSLIKHFPLFNICL